MDSAQSPSRRCSDVGVLNDLGVHLDINQCRVELIAESGRKNAMLDSSQVKDEEQKKPIKILHAMEEKMNQLLVIHQEQVDSLRDEISQKHDLITSLKETNKQYKWKLEKMQKDFEKHEKGKSEKSQEMTETKILQEEAGEENNFCALRGAVNKELQTLHVLRQLFVHYLQARMKRSENPDENKVEDSCLAQKQNIRVPEDDLDEFTKVYRMIMRESAELRCEVAKLSGIAQAKSERIKVLETALMDAKKKMFRDRERLTCFLDRNKIDGDALEDFSSSALCRQYVLRNKTEDDGST